MRQCGRTFLFVLVPLSREDGPSDDCSTTIPVIVLHIATYGAEESHGGEELLAQHLQARTATNDRISLGEAQGTGELGRKIRE